MSFKRVMGITILAAVLAPGGAQAMGGDDHGDLHPHHLALFLGAGLETGREGGEKDKGFAAGLEYEYRFHERWGVGGVFETLGGDTIREISLIVPVSLRPVGGLRLVAGPGYETTEKKDKFLLRLGAGYEFHLGGNWTLAPELNADFVDGGAIIWLGGVAIGYGF